MFDYYILFLNDYVSLSNIFYYFILQVNKCTSLQNITTAGTLQLLIFTVQHLKKHYKIYLVRHLTNGDRRLRMHQVQYKEALVD